MQPSLIKHRFALTSLLALSSLCLVASAQQAPPPGGPGGGGRGPRELGVHVLKEGKLYWLDGGGGNSGVIIGQNGVIIIDAKTTAANGKQIIDAVAKLTPKPITTVVLTHSDGDHVNGLAGFPDGLKIIAHENNKQEQEATFLYAGVEIDGGKCLPPADRLPNQVISKEKVSAKIEGVNFVFYHFGPAHTNGDLVVSLPDDKVVFTGDLLTSTVLVHTEKNGSFDGWFNNAKGLLSIDADTYVGGHANETDTKASIQKRIAGYQAIKDKVDGMVKDGKSLAEVKEAMGDPPKNPAGCRGIQYLSLPEVEFRAQTDKNEELK